MKLREHRRQAIMDRVWEQIWVSPDGCWIWTGGNSGDGRGGGYGRIPLGGCMMAVHRVVFTHYNGIIPHKKQIDHTCGNRLCCNPDHLELVTHKENQRRRDKKNV